MANKKMVLPIIALFSAMTLSSCGNDKNPGTPVDTRDANIVSVYNAYKTKAQREGNVVLDYDTWLATIKGEKGATGATGKSAYELAVDQGFTGTINDWLASLVGHNGSTGDAGKSAFEIAVAAGFSGTEAEWLASLHGTNGTNGDDGVTPHIDATTGHWFIGDTDTGINATGDPGVAPHIDTTTGHWFIGETDTGVKATGDTGEAGATGKSAYAIFKEHYPHYTGTEADFAHDLAEGKLAGMLPGHEDSMSYTLVETDTEVSIAGHCDFCNVDTEVVESMAKKVGAQYHIDTSRTPSWNNTSGNTWESANKGVHSSTSYIDLIADSAGTVTFNWSSSGEGGYDYFFAVKNSTSESSAFVTAKGSGTGVHNISGTETIEVAENDQIHFMFKKDSGGSAGNDCAIVTFAPSIFEYGMVEFDSRGGSHVDPMITENGTITGELPTPTKENAYFDGWFLDKGCQVPYTSGTVLEENAKLFAKWVDAITVTYYDNDMSGDFTAIPFKPGTTVPTIEDPVRYGHIFMGWYTTPTDQFIKFKPASASTSVVAYAKWVALEDVNPLHGNYAGFKFKPNSSSSSDISVSYPELEIFADGSYSLRTGYTYFDEGFLNETVSGVTETTNNGNMYSFANDTVMFIHEGSAYSTGQYMYVLQKDGTTSKSGVTVKNFDKVTFVSFKVGDEPVIAMIDNTTGAITYDVTLKNAAGDVLALSDIGKSAASAMYFRVFADSTMIAEFGYGTSNTTLIDTFTMARGNYTATDGATLALNGAGKAVMSKIGSSTVATVIDEGDGVYTVYSGVNYYTIVLDDVGKTFSYEVKHATGTFVANGGAFADGDTSKTADVVCGSWYDADDLVADPTWAGHVFMGWFTAAEGGDAKGRLQYSGDMTLYAHWEVAVDITLHLNNGSEDVTNSYIENSTINLSTPVKSEAVFEGWYTDEALTTPFEGKAVTTVTDVYAKYFDIDFAGTYKGDEVCWSTYYNKTGNGAYSLTIADDGKMTGKASSTLAGAKSADGHKIDLATGGYKLYTFEANGRRFVCMHYNGLSTNSYLTSDMGMFVKVNDGETVKFVYSSLASGKYAVKVTITGTSTETFNFYVDNNSAVQELETDVLFTLNGNIITASDITADNRSNVVVVKNPIKTADQFKAAVENGGDVKLYGNIALTEVVVADKDVTIDLNGHIITTDESYDSWYMLKSTAGTMTIMDSVGTGRVIAREGTNNIPVSATNDGALVINSGTFVGLDKSEAVYIRDSASCIINGGTFDHIGDDTHGFDHIVNVNVQNEANLSQLVINGGTFSCDPRLGDDAIPGSYIGSTKDVVTRTIAGITFFDVITPHVESIAITMPVDRIGPGESTTLTANVNVVGTISDEVTWSMTCTTAGHEGRLTITDNNDGTCTLNGQNSLDSGFVDSFKVTATSVADPTISKTITFYASNFPTTRIQAIIDFVGEDYVLPYCTFRAVGDFQLDEKYDYDSYSYVDCVTGYTKNADDYKNVIKAFDNNGTFVKTVEGSHTIYTKHIEGTEFDVKYDVYGGGYSYVDVYKVASPLTSFPTEAINEFLSGKTTSTFVAPTDGTAFVYDDSAADYGRVTVTCTGSSLTDYCDALVTAGFIDCENGYFLSPEKTLIIHATTNSSGAMELTISYDSERVVKTAWTDGDKAAMTQHCGCVLPFFDGGFEISYNTYYKTIATSYSVDAFVSAVSAFESDTDFTLKSSTAYSYVFTKDVDDCVLTVTITDNGSYVDVKVELVAPTPTSGDLVEWPTTDVASHVAAAAGMPIPTGTSFSLTVNSSNDITITVFGGDRYTFTQALKGAGYRSMSAATSSQPESFATNAYDHYIDVSMADTNGVYTVNIYAGW